MITDTKFYSNGKLLLTGEYVVLDGAKALAVPTQYGQYLKITTTSNSIIEWTSYSYKNSSWFSCTLDDKLNILKSSNEEIASNLKTILKATVLLNPGFEYAGNRIETTLDFPRKWGLGTSSTLINNIAQWANVNPYDLLHLTFGGSGYDIACAIHNSPILYNLPSKSEQRITPVNFNPLFKEHLYFLYLNKKKNSREGIAEYTFNKKKIITETITEISEITKKLIGSTTLLEFEHLLNTHEKIISKTIKQPTVKSTFFSDFNGSIKSLGAWGGDFILASSEENPKEYFKNKGFKTIVTYSDMVLNP